MTPVLRIRPLAATLLLVPTLMVQGCGGDQHKERVILEAAEVHEGWFFGAGDIVIIDGTVNGDAYLAGGTIEFNGTVNGDLIVAGGNITINGTVSDDIRVAGGSVTLGGIVGKDVTAAGGTVALGAGANIRGNVLSAGGNLSIDGSVGKEVKAASGRMTLKGSIGKDVHFAGGTLQVLSGAQVGGDLHAETEDSTDVDIAAGTVSGSVQHLTHEKSNGRDILGLTPLHFWFRVFWMGSLLATTLALTFLFPGQLNRLGTVTTDQPLQVGVWGLAGLFTIPAVSLLLVASVIGIPLGLLLSAAYCWILYLSQVAMSVVLGQRLFSSTDAKGWRLFGILAAGIGIIQVLTMVPIFRFFVLAIVVTFGVGSILRVMREEYRARA